MSGQKYATGRSCDLRMEKRDRVNPKKCPESSSFHLYIYVGDLKKGEHQKIFLERCVKKEYSPAYKKEGTGKMAISVLGEWTKICNGTAL